MVESARKAKFDKLEKLQEKALRFVDNDMHSYREIDEMYRQHNVQPLSLRF